MNYSKLKEVFQLAGRVVKVDLMLDRDNKSRGMATVTYEDPMDAAQAICKYFTRTLILLSFSSSCYLFYSRNQRLQLVVIFSILLNY